MKPSTTFIFPMAGGIRYVFGLTEKAAVAAIFKACGGKFSPNETNYNRNKAFNDAVECVKNPPVFAQFMGLHGRHPRDLNARQWQELAKTQSARRRTTKWIEVGVEQEAQKHIEFLEVHGHTVDKGSATKVIDDCISSIVTVFQKHGYELTDDQVLGIIRHASIKKLLPRQEKLKTFDAFWSQYKREKKSLLEFSSQKKQHHKSVTYVGFFGADIDAVKAEYNKLKHKGRTNSHKTTSKKDHPWNR